MRVRLVVRWNPRTRGGETFLSPMPVPVRSAVLFPGFAETDWVRVFADGWSREVAEFRPELLAAPLTELRRVAARAASRRIALPSLSHAVVVFTGASQPSLTAGDRDFFWRVFQVPLFEQFLGAAGETLAIECDAHEGLHVLPGRANASELAGSIEIACCPCGKPGGRLFLPRPAALAAAAGD